MHSGKCNRVNYLTTLHEFLCIITDIFMNHVWLVERQDLFSVNPFATGEDLNMLNISARNVFSRNSWRNVSSVPILGT